MTRLRPLIAALVLCACAPLEGARDDREVDVARAALRDPAQRRARAARIRDAARARGIDDGALMIAMLAEEETFMSQCLFEYGIPACSGPTSADCGGRAVLSGGGDGPCARDQGGLGMFQIDDGTESQTVAVHGPRVLSIDGNIEVGIDRVLQKIVDSRYLSVSDTAGAIAFLNGLRIDDANWDAYVRTLVRYWNGCREGSRCWPSRYPKYDHAARTLLSEMGRDFWYGESSPPPAGSGWIASPIASPRVTSHVSHARGSGWARHDCTRLTRANHRGTDFGVPVGTEVRAAAAGTVLRSVTGCPARGSMSSTCGGSFGNHVIVVHDGGLATLYAHLSPDGTQARRGARVECGDVLGHSGNSGRSSGPHLHFEVRSGVRDEATYFRRGNTIDPYGGSCSSQPEALWIGGSPMASCMAAEREDAVVLRSTFPREITAVGGASLTQVVRWRNRGTTTWSARDYVMRHQSGAFSEVSEVPLPEGTRVAPGGELELRVTVMVPAAPGLHRGAWRMARRDGAAFGSELVLAARVASSPRACRSATLGREVASGSCVQVTYPTCGVWTCGWSRCVDGTWQCADEGACTAERFDHAECEVPPPPDAGVDDASTCGGGSPLGGACERSEDCCDGLSCSSDGTGGQACCRAGSERCASSAECCGAMTCSMGFCECVPVDGACEGDADCCAGLGCIAGACRDVSGCSRETTACESASECCYPLRCQDTSGGGPSTCCIGGGAPCEGNNECCGDMQCVGGSCACRAEGESCSNLLDCCGALLCEGGVCV